VSTIPIRSDRYFRAAGLKKGKADAFDQFFPYNLAMHLLLE
jgi:hypothetical protein